MSKKLCFDDVVAEFNAYGYTVLSKTYEGAKIPIKYFCPSGHIGEVTYNNFKYNKRRCPLCKGGIPLSLDVVKSFVKFINLTLIDGDYKNVNSVIVCKCDICGSVFSTSYSNLKYNGGGCKKCKRDNNKVEFFKSKIAPSFESEGYRLKTTPESYVNANFYIEYICDNGHANSITWANWYNGFRCPDCAGNRKYTFSEVFDDITGFGYEVVDDEYYSCKQKLHLICPNGHDYHVTWDNWHNKGYRCPRCSNVGTSYQEAELVDFIESIYNKEIIYRSRHIIPPLELDIVLPDINLAIEYCGIYWHSELAGKDSKYHLIKLNMCNDKDMNLFTIFEDELVFKKNILESVLKNKLNCFDGVRVYARNCQVRELTVQQAREFCEQNHLQGYTGSSIKLGLFYDEGLVSVMTFSKQSTAKDSKYEVCYWELNRFCNKINHQVVGGASKLLKYFERNYSWTKITSYADRRWSDGNMYYKLGFNFEKFTKPNYWYYKEQKRIHRFALRRRSEGYNRIWDCGNYKFIKHKL